MRSNESSKSAKRTVTLKLERLENRLTPCLATGQDIAALALRSDASTGLVGSMAKYCMADS